MWVVLELHQRRKQALFGDAARPDTLRAARLGAAAYLIVAVPHADISLRIIQAAREVAPLVRIITRAEYINQSEAFVQAGAAIIRYDEAESAAALAEVCCKTSTCRRSECEQDPQRTRAAPPQPND